jgi:hypothetical protein
MFSGCLSVSAGLTSFASGIEAMSGQMSPVHFGRELYTPVRVMARQNLPDGRSGASDVPSCPS